MPPSSNRIAFYRDRCNPPLTQKTLAAALGVHVNTITLWECEGVASAANLLRLVRLFAEHGALTDETTALNFWQVSGRRAFEPPPELNCLFRSENVHWALPIDDVPLPGPQCAPSVLPFALNPFFVGRTQDFTIIATAFQLTSQVVIAGIGGIGKTQLAAEFAHRYGRWFAGGVFWINCENSETIASQVAQCGGAGRLDLHPRFNEYSLDEQVRMVQHAWQSQVPRLLVFDNCENAHTFAQWRPTSGGCRILLTSRCAIWPVSLGIYTHVLASFTCIESIDLLRRYYPAGNYDDFAQIADTLGGLPLALHVAGSFLARYWHVLTPREYAMRLAKEGLLPYLARAANDFSPTNHSHDVDRTFALSYERIEQHHPQDAIALILAQRIAYLGPGEPIGSELVQHILPEVLGAFDVENVTQRLLELGLIERAADQSVRMHRLQSAFIRRRNPQTEALEAVAHVLFEQVQRLSQHCTFDAILALQPHIYEVVQAAEPANARWSAKLSGAMGWEFTRLSDYTTARRYLDRSLELNLSVYGPEHAETAEIYNLLGLWSQARGYMPEALSHFQRAERIREHWFGKLHLKTAQSYNNMGYLLVVSGEYGWAEAYFQRARSILEALLPAGHSDISRILNNLGFLYFRSGQFEASRPLLEQALTLRLHSLPDPHLATALTLTNLGELLYRQGELAKAETSIRHGFMMRTALISGQHNAVAESINRLGRICLARGDDREAERRYREALSMLEQQAFANPYELAVLHLDLAELLSQRQQTFEFDRHFAAVRRLFDGALPGVVRYFTHNQPERLYPALS